MYLSINITLIIGIIVIILLIALFFITFVINQKTPVPPGCEDILKDVEKCNACNNKACRFYEDKEEKIMEEK